MWVYDARLTIYLYLRYSIYILLNDIPISIFGKQSIIPLMLQNMDKSLHNALVLMFFAICLCVSMIIIMVV